MLSTHLWDYIKANTDSLASPAVLFSWFPSEMFFLLHFATHQIMLLLRWLHTFTFNYSFSLYYVPSTWNIFMRYLLTTFQSLWCFTYSLFTSIFSPFHPYHLERGLINVLNSLGYFLLWVIQSVNLSTNKSTSPSLWLINDIWTWDLRGSALMVPYSIILSPYSSFSCCQWESRSQTNSLFPF